MSSTQIDESVAENYRQVKAESGRTWEEIAEQFERDAAPLPPEHGAPYLTLARWAREQKHEPDADLVDELVDQPDAGAETAAEAETDTEAETDAELATRSEPEQPEAPTAPRKRTTADKRPSRTS